MSRFTPRRFAVIIGGFGLTIFGLYLVAIWLQTPVLQRLFFPRQTTMRQSCSVNMRQVYLGLKIYSADFDGQFPPAQIGGKQVSGWPNPDKPYPPIISPPQVQAYIKAAGLPVGWADATYLYIHSNSIFTCPAQTSTGLAPNRSGFTDFYFNGNLASKKSVSLSFPASTLALGEGNDGTDLSDATYNKTSLPPSWLIDSSKPTFRHLGGANYLFADGHLAWLKPGQVTNYGGRKNSFALR